MGGSAGNLGGFGSRFGNKNSGGFTNYKPPGGYFGGNMPPRPQQPFLPGTSGGKPFQGFGSMNRNPMPPSGNSASAGPQAPGGSPMGGQMFPGGERPGTYGATPGLIGNSGGQMPGVQQQFGPSAPPNYSNVTIDPMFASLPPDLARQLSYEKQNGVGMGQAQLW